MGSLSGVYEGLIISVGDGNASAFIPQVFGETTVTVSDFLVDPAPGRGWVAFQAGDPEHPVWLSGFFGNPGETISFGPVTPQTAFAAPTDDGVLNAAARADHTHGTPVHSIAIHAPIPISTFSAALGSINMGLQRIINVATPAAPNDAVPKNYVDSSIASAVSSAGATTYTKMVGLDCAAALTTVVTHNFNTRDVQVQVYRNTTPWDNVEADVERTSVNAVTVRFGAAPTAAQYRIVVVGIDL